MAGIGQYLKETQTELRHVAWPTRMQTIVYTALVALISLGVAAYLGLFDYVFTTGLSRVITSSPAPATTQRQAPSSAPAAAPSFSIPTSTSR